MLADDPAAVQKHSFHPLSCVCLKQEAGQVYVEQL